MSPVKDLEGRPIVVFSARRLPPKDPEWIAMLIDALEVSNRTMPCRVVPCRDVCPFFVCWFVSKKKSFFVLLRCLSSYLFLCLFYLYMCVCLSALLCLSVPTRLSLCLSVRLIRVFSPASVGMPACACLYLCLLSLFVLAVSLSVAVSVSVPCLTSLCVLRRNDHP